MKFYYYKITNIKNNKFYIGITENYQKRWQQHKNLLLNNKHPNYKLQKDWNVYKEESFIFEIILEKEFNTIEEGYHQEYELIENLKAISKGYNILQGGLLNPMYTDTAKEKMTKTKQEQVPNIYQLEEIAENKFKIINKFNSQKEAQRIKGYSQANIQKSIQKHIKGDGYYWLTEEQLKDIENWKPKRLRFVPIGEIVKDKIIDAWYSPRVLEKQEDWAISSIVNAIARNGQTHNRKFIYLSEEEYFKIKPVIII